MHAGLPNRRLLMVFCAGLAACQADTDPGTATNEALGGTGAGSAATGGVTVAPPAGSGGMPGAGIGGGAAGVGTTGGSSGLGAGGMAGATSAGGTGAAGTGAGAAGASAGMGGGSAAGAGGGAGQVSVPTERFSFFVTSLEAMLELSGNDQGFGGDLRFGEATGLAGADKICATIADMSLPGASGKQWRAFLSASSGGPNGGPVHARDRVGEGPWYDRMGRLIAMDLAALLQTRPAGADALIANDLPNEHGEPNQMGVDNHDTVTGSNAMGQYDGGETCEDWTNAPPFEQGEAGGGFPGSGHRGPTVGHSWPARSGQSWISAHPSGGCAPRVNLVQDGPGTGNGIGSGGGYGGLYCLALMP